MYHLRAYNLLDDVEKEAPHPSGSFVYLEIAARGEKNGRLVVGPSMASDGEIDNFVEQMKGELEEFRKAAKKSLRDYESR